jgi:hypothetical protein
MTVLSSHTALAKYLNTALRPLAGWIPPLAVLHHRTRRSGKRNATPVQALRTDTGFIVGLAHSANANRTRNTLWFAPDFATEGPPRADSRVVVSSDVLRGASHVRAVPSPAAQEAVGRDELGDLLAGDRQNPRTVGIEQGDTQRTTSASPQHDPVIYLEPRTAADSRATAPCGHASALAVGAVRSPQVQ